VAVAAYVLIFSLYSILRYYSFRTYFYDLGINAYSLSGVLNGRDGIETLVLPSSLGYLGHFSPMMLIPLGAYSLFPYPETLLIIQSLALGLAALPLFNLAEGVLGRRDKAFLIAAAYLLYAPLHGVNRYDFHVEAFLPLLSFVALNAIVRDRYRLFLFASLMLLMTHEFVSIMYVFAGGVLLFHHCAVKRKPLRGWARGPFVETMLLLGAAFLVLSEALSRALAGRSLLNWLEVYPGQPGGSVAYLSWESIVADLLTKSIYWLLLLFPLLFTPLLKWKAFVAAVPWLAVSVASSRLPYHSIYYQYPAFIIAPLFFATLLAICHPKPHGFIARHAESMPTMIVAATLAVSLLFSVLSPLNPWDGLQASAPLESYPPGVTIHDIATSRLLGEIPLDSTVLAQNELFSQLSNRREVLLSWDPGRATPPDYVAVDVSRIFYRGSPAPFQDPLSKQLPALLSNYSYGLVGFSDTTFVYGIGGRLRPDYATQVAAMPPAPDAFAAKWSWVDATATYGTGDVEVRPSGTGPGFLWTGLDEPQKSFFLASTLGPRSPGPQGWFGIVVNFLAEANYSMVYFLPQLGQVHYAAVAPGNVTDRLVGNYSASQAGIPVRVLWSGGTIQVWVAGYLAGLVYKAAGAATRTLGFVTSGVDLEVSSLAAYGSTADRVPPGPDVPWSAVGAFLTIVVPTMFLVVYWDWIMVRVRRITAVLRFP
jgi:uncharacterized membrane protein